MVHRLCYGIASKIRNDGLVGALGLNVVLGISLFYILGNLRYTLIQNDIIGVLVPRCYAVLIVS